MTKKGGSASIYISGQHKVSRDKKPLQRRSRPISVLIDVSVTTSLPIALHRYTAAQELGDRQVPSSAKSYGVNK